MDKQSSKIVWTENAVEDYKKILDYLTGFWPENSALNFIIIMKNKLFVLKNNQKMGIKSEKIKNVRSILITKHNRLYYRVRHNNIELLNIFDTRQNPTKNPY